MTIRLSPGIPMQRVRFILLIWGLIVSTCAPGVSSEPILGEQQERIIHYEATSELVDPVAELQKRLAAGKTSLSYDPRRGYLPALLKALDIPVSSQSLVFSKTSSQRDHTSPQTPRAIYFSDEVTIGWTPESPSIDLSSIDPQKGPIFYKLDQHREKLPRFQRDSECMQCHLNGRTLQVPGLLVRSVYADAQGMPRAKVSDFVSGHNSPLRDRWGGWYVTGTHRDQVHLGNIFATNLDNPEVIDASAGANVTNLSGRFDTSVYFGPHSDIVALLVLEHQVRMQNLLTRAHYETRYALDEMARKSRMISNEDPGASDRCRERIGTAGEELLAYMLFRDEAPLSGLVRGTSGFTEEFALGEPFDSKRRSLRQFDLKTRLFRFPCSYLIYSRSFDGLPIEMRTYVWERLRQILTGQDRSPTYVGMNASDRQNILEILRETKPEFAEFLNSRAHGSRTHLRL